ncbi:MAG: hydrogenase expression/formation protein HypE [Candidatus Thiodiazotropha sp. (ex. Lucinisca nassula)]|nr:hydrogenase expression/formation protein HypE [Candidatus Thiodiazotropha sp. (ex. Lucinisca nassula)]PUB82599.1 MAG: hydrogenase expression/formation protein HypE [gamma proteobacterium symbiont of Ctena orbiculata]PUB90284.1 MAG: hydrogenase expression/formation protein HypE [gamma proteobacterium symbiont of Ctena orbiculata]
MTLQDTHISLAHGNGGRYMRELIESLFARYLKNANLDIQADAAVLPGLNNGDLLFTTDGFTVQPLEFPGGDIGSLAVHGTVNDLAVSGATPKYLSLNAFIEEGFELARLEGIIKSIADTANAVGVQVVAGDTKVVRRGEGGGIYLATTGIGLRDDRLNLGVGMIEPGDKLLVSGPVGDHGIAVMLAREQFGLRGDVKSDAGSVLPFTQALLDLPGLRFMRDPTRGGVATVAHEICRSTGLQVRLDQAAIPVRDPVNSVCEMLGYDPLFLACEGRVVAVVAADQADAALGRWKNLPGGDMVSLIGETRQEDPYVILETDLGGARILEELEDDPLPRIC